MTDYYGTITRSDHTSGVIIEREYLAGVAEPMHFAAWRCMEYDVKLYNGLTEADHFDQLCDVLEYAEADIG